MTGQCHGRCTVLGWATWYGAWLVLRLLLKILRSCVGFQFFFFKKIIFDGALPEQKEKKFCGSSFDLFSSEIQLIVNVPYSHRVWQEKR